ncbi:UPF0246 protein YaaA [hydrothermal vent metagenome]|uniref:UPF0246 protein YaaA n=1 Tax=hydrothermal vent metagenome TaxID=652676 RepID=A0A3B0YQU5_9ZZZZ
MLIVISPAKTLDYDTPSKTKNHTIPGFLESSQKLIDTLKKITKADLMSLMNISEKIASVNYKRYREWVLPLTVSNAKQCIYAFKGEVYTGLDIDQFNAADIKYCQSHLRILSGLYGLLRPLDLMFPYRLEMGTRLNTDAGKNLYAYWDDTITEAINKLLAKQKDGILLNLASNEYFKSVRPIKLEGEVISPAFKEYKNGDYKMLGVYAKRARGLMSRYVLKNRVENIEDIKLFDLDGYKFNKTLSKNNQWVFTRRR